MTPRPRWAVTPRRRCGAGLLAAVVAGVLAGCGVPSSSAPIDRGAAPPVAERRVTAPPAPLGPESASSPKDLIQKYLQAAAWGNSQGGDRKSAIDEAEERVRRFLTPQAAQSWTAANRDMVLVRISLGAQRIEGDGTTDIDAALEPVGVLNDFGAVDPPADAKPYDFTFRVVTLNGGLRLAAVPAGLLFDVAEIETWYDPHPIYFWDGPDPNAVLVPDLRYMPKAVLDDKQPKEIWRWLTKGPSKLLGNAAQPLPDNVDNKGNLVTEQQRGDSVLVLDLTSEAARVSQQLQNVVIQFRWSLRPIDTSVELRIEGGTRKDVDGWSDQYLLRNPAVWPPAQSAADRPEKLVVIDGKARAQDVSGDRNPVVFTSAENRDVISAALARTGDQQLAALVRREAGGQRLLLGRLAGRGESRAPEYRATDVVGATMTRPSWLVRPIQQVLVAVDGRLLAVNENRKVEVAAPGALPGPVTAVAAAPDGHRIALVAGGVAGVAPLRVEGDTVSLGAFRPLATSPVTPWGIGWSREDRLLVGGAGPGGSALVELSVDGVFRETLKRNDFSGLKIDRLVVYPADARSKDSGPPLAMFESDGQAYIVYRSQVTPLRTLDGPVASPSAAPNRPPPVPSAPFFLEEY